MNKKCLCLFIFLAFNSCQTQKHKETNYDRNPTQVNNDVVIPTEVLLPISESDASLLTSETQRTTELLNTVDSDFAQKLKARAAELGPKNGLVKTNYFGKEFAFIKGSLVQFNSNAEPEIILDSSLLPKGAGFVDFRISPDQTKIVFGYSFYGSDWQTWKIYDIKAKSILDSDGQFVFKSLGGPGLTWMPDSNRILYPKDLEIGLDIKGQRQPQIAIHTVGLDQSKDQIIFKNFESPEFSRWRALAIDNDNVVVFRVLGVATFPGSAFLIDLKSGQKKSLIQPHKYLTGTPGASLTGLKDGILYIRTSQIGDHYGILAVDTKASDPIKSAVTIVANDSDSVLYQASLIGNKILTQYILKDLSVEFRLIDLQGKIVSRMKPSDFNITDFGLPGLPLTNADATSTSAYFSYSAIENAPVTFKVDSMTNQFSKIDDVAKVNFDGSQIEKEVVTYPSHDGKKITMFLYSRKDLKNKQASFAYVYSYGFIGIPNLSQYNRKFQLALEMGGLIALPMVRGGGEYGANHQLSGVKNRINTIQDMAFAAKWLKKNKNIKENRVVAVGRSYEGLMTAAQYVHNQNDFDLFSAIVPLTDMISALNAGSWWGADDQGLKRDSKSGKSNQSNFNQMLSSVQNWNPASHVNKLQNKALKPLVLFAMQYDANANPLQSADFFKLLTKTNPNQPVYLYQHLNGGHGARAELVDEFLFISKFFQLTEINPIVAQ